MTDRRTPPGRFLPGQPEIRRLADVLREETIGGALILAAALVAIAWANSPWSDGYESLRAWSVGPASLRLHLPLASWAADLLLAIFFFVAGVELKREFVAGELRHLRRAAVPVAAAVGGVVVPAVLYLAITIGAGGAARGWAIPTATDIAFVLATLAVVGGALPPAGRTFLLTLAVVDDLIAIVILALFYTTRLSLAPFLLALVPLAAFALIARRGRLMWMLLPCAAATWALVHASGVHATVAGLLLALTVPIAKTDEGYGGPLAECVERVWRPVSAVVAVPLFALLSVGVPLHGVGGLRSALADRIAVAVAAALVVGKPLGVLLGIWLVTRIAAAEYDVSLDRRDILALALLAGIGFTVSLLVSELAFGIGDARADHAKVAVVVASCGAALLAAIVCHWPRRTTRRRRRPA